MADLYTSLQVSPRKKRCPPEFYDDNIATPKKLRTAPITPPATTRKGAGLILSPIPTHLSRLHAIQTALQHALSHALATCAVSPTSDTGIVRNVLNHYSLTTYTGLTTKFDVDDLRRLCWLWEWDGETLPKLKDQADAKASKVEDDDENPFLEPKPSADPKDWTRGSMGLIVSPTSHFLKSAGKRVPAYGIGIEVDMDIDKDMGGGMAAVARWTAASEVRRKDFRNKLEKWRKLHSSVDPLPQIPLADLPQLQIPVKISSLTSALASASPKGPSSLTFPVPPSSPTKTPSKSPSKSLLKTPSKKTSTNREFAIPFPITPTSKIASGLKNSLPFPQTPSSSQNERRALDNLTPRTPRTSLATPTPSEPSTPVHQKGSNAFTVPQTPTTSRRLALYERVRQRSLTASPTKPSPSKEIVGGKLTKDQIMKMGQEEMRRRCLLGRLGGVAESVWMLFSRPSGSTPTPSLRKRRALPASEVVTAVIKSSPVPISSAEAQESLSILTNLCPFFLKPLDISGEDWLEMPAPTPVEDPSSPTKLSSGHGLQSSPGRLRSKDDSAEEVRTRSPRRVKKEAGGLRQVREIIRRELELQD